MIKYLRKFGVYIIKHFFQIDIYYNVYDNKLYINLPPNLMVHINNDINIESSGSFNLTTYGNPICIDSVNSKIFLNSLKSKSVRDSKEYLTLRELYLKKLSILKSREFNVKKELSEVKETLVNLNNKLNNIENVDE